MTCEHLGDTNILGFPSEKKRRELEREENMMRKARKKKKRTWSGFGDDLNIGSEIDPDDLQSSFDDVLF